MLSVSALSKDYRNERGQPVMAARDVTFEVPEGEMFTLLGPSGCGKTTTLRSIAGLERPNAGEIVADGRTVFSSDRRVFVAPNRRGFGMVFQSYAIWPHMTVFDNVAFALEVERGLTRAHIRERVMEVLSVVALNELAGRRATRLSGGQQQRLALARALVKAPRLLLLDEPLSNLDAKLRERMRFELKRLQRELGLTTVYVTHDQSEALALSHQIAVMNEGRIVQIGRPRDIYSRPQSRFVADFVGTTNFLEGRVEGPVQGPVQGGGLFRLATPCGPLVVAASEPLATGAEATFSVRPETIGVTATRPDAANVWQGTVENRAFLGDTQDLQVKVGTAVLQARVAASLEMDAGSTVFLTIDPARCTHVADPGGTPG